MLVSHLHCRVINVGTGAAVDGEHVEDQVLAILCRLAGECADEATTSHTHLPDCASRLGWVTGIRTSCGTQVPR
jgi:hypothetical protein